MSEAQRDLRVFPTTHWSQVESAGMESAQPRKPAMEELLRQYMPPMRAHLLLRRRVGAEQVDDLLQSFISGKVLASGLLGHADRTRGRFRTFLLTALDRFVISQQRHAHAGKRGAHRTQSLDAGPDPPNLPEAACGRGDTFDVEWARQILRQALERMRTQCEAEGRADLWGVFRSRVIGPTLLGEKPAAYDDVIARYSYRTPSQLWNAVRSGKQMFASTLRQVISQYTDSSDQIEEELADLREICARPAQADEVAAYP
jgi:RNA polymerase sigma-70 factor (ECF subfamily)